MTSPSDKALSAFNRNMKYWRQKRRLSQLELAGLAGTTSRHISFIETGRSRPGHDLVLRLAKALNLSVRDTNTFLQSAGFAPVYPDLQPTDEIIQPYLDAIHAILEKHDPFPACAMDPLGQVLFANRSFVAFAPQALTQTPEEKIETFFVPMGPGRDLVENWEEVVWHLLDRQKAELTISNHPRLAKLVKRGEALLKDVPRLHPQNPGNGAFVFSPRLRIGDQIVSTFATLMRFENASEVTLSEIRIELVFPADAVSQAFFENLAESNTAAPFKGIGASTLNG
jgi:transcriptional regulator with XRE-family HTH domain